MAVGRPPEIRHAAPRDDQTIIIADGKIQSIGPEATTEIPANARFLDLKGDYTVLPGLVGMHDHMFFPMGGTPPMYSDMGTSFPRLYLALGVTTIRTTGSVEPYNDLEIKKLIDSGRMIGPKMRVTAPYLEGVGSFTPVMHTLTGPDDARHLGIATAVRAIEHRHDVPRLGRRLAAGAVAQGCR